MVTKISESKRRKRNLKESYYPYNYHGYKYDYELNDDETEPSSGVDIYDDDDNYITTVATVHEAENYIDELGFSKVHPGHAKISDSDFETFIDIMANYAKRRLDSGKPINDEILIDWCCKVNDDFADIYDKLWYHNEDEAFVRKMASALKERGIDIGKTIYDESCGKKKKSSKRNLKEAENYGWVVNSDEAWDALDAFTEVYGAEYTLESLAKAMGTDELAENLAYIFRMHDFREFYGEDDDYDYDEDLDESCGKRKEKTEFVKVNEEYSKKINLGLDRVDIENVKSLVEEIQTIAEGKDVYIHDPITDKEKEVRSKENNLIHCISELQPILWDFIDYVNEVCPSTYRNGLSHKAEYFNKLCRDIIKDKSDLYDFLWDSLERPNKVILSYNRRLLRDLTRFYKNQEAFKKNNRITTDELQKIGLDEGCGKRKSNRS